MKLIKVHCYACDEYYEILSSHSKEILMLNILYAKCKHCGTPRDPVMFGNYPMRCFDCNVPINRKNAKDWHRYKGKNLCHNHYMVRYRKLHKKANNI